MAELKNQGLSGSIGEVSLYQRNGKTIVRKKKNDPSSRKRSPAQKRNEDAFKAAQDWVKPVQEFAKIGFRNYGNYTYPQNAAKAYIKMNAVREENGVFSVDPALAKLSMGSLPNPQDLQATLVSGQLLQFTWNPALEGKMSPRDRIMMLAYNSASGMAVYSLRGAFRMEGVASLDISQLGTANFHVYAAFVSEKGQNQSESLYLGERHS